MSLPSKYEDGLSDLDYRAALTAQEPEEDFADEAADNEEDESEADYTDEEDD